jgi:hypothetical protein
VSLKTEARLSTEAKLWLYDSLIVAKTGLFVERRQQARYLAVQQTATLERKQENVFSLQM